MKAQKFAINNLVAMMVLLIMNYDVKKTSRMNQWLLIALLTNEHIFIARLTEKKAFNAKPYGN